VRGPTGATTLRRTGATTLRRTGAALLLAAAAVVTAAALQDRQPRFDGEYGLWVRLDRDSVVAHWLTSHTSPGRAELGPAGSPIRTATTPRSQVHRAAFARPRGNEVLLRYGADNGDPLHETSIVLTPPRRPAVSYSRVDSLFIVGDTHGEFDALFLSLQRADLVDGHGRWSGGRKHLVFAGDLTDRGPDVLRLLWFVYRLEREAAQAGGRVHVLLGNHEIMVMLGDLRYVHPKEAAIAEHHGVRYDSMFDTRHSILGRWLVSKPAMIRIDGVLVAHGGIAPEYAQLTLRGFDAMLAKYTGEELFHRWADSTFLPQLDSLGYLAREDFFWGPRSVFWHREYVENVTTSSELEQALRYLDARMLVVGHTPAATIEALHEGRLIAAHTPRMGGELLLLVRDGRGHRRFRVGQEGPPEQF
jgi:hypothetical protein